MAGDRTRGLRPWKPGQSGNPKGRPRLPEEVKLAAQEYTEKAIERLGHWLDSDNAKASVAAADKLLERGWGKAAQPLEHSGEINITGLGALLADADGETKGA